MNYECSASNVLLMSLMTAVAAASFSALVPASQGVGTLFCKLLIRCTLCTRPETHYA